MLECSITDTLEVELIDLSDDDPITQLIEDVKIAQTTIGDATEEEIQELRVLKILRLDSNCLLCQSQSLRISSDGSTEYQAWKKLCADSMCQSLRIAERPISSVLFKRAVYCEACFQIFSDFQFVERSIQRLQKRLQELIETAQDLIVRNCRDLESSQDKTGAEYFEAVKCIRRELSIKNKGYDAMTPSPHGHDSSYTTSGRHLGDLSNFIGHEQITACDRDDDEQNDADYIHPGSLPSDTESEAGVGDHGAGSARLTSRIIEVVNEEHIRKNRRQAIQAEIALNTTHNLHGTAQINLGLSTNNLRLLAPAPPPAPNNNSASQSNEEGALSQKQIRKESERGILRRVALAGKRMANESRDSPTSAQIPGAASVQLLTPHQGQTTVSTAPLITPLEGFPRFRIVAQNVIPAGSRLPATAQPLTFISAAAPVPNEMPNGSKLRRLAPAPISVTNPPISFLAQSAATSALPFLTFWVPKTPNGVNANVTAAVAAPDTSGPEVIYLSDNDNPPPAEDKGKEPNVPRKRGRSCHRDRDQAPDESRRSRKSRDMASKASKVPKRPNQRPLKTVPCSYAGCSFRLFPKGLSSMESHIRSAHEGDPRPFHCPSCPSRFRVAYRLQLHISKCHEDPLPCPHCPASCAGKDNLKKHIDSQHPAYTFWPKCTVCSKIVSEADLAQHQSLHKDASFENGFPCVLCDCSIFVTQQDLVRHVNDAHEDEHRKFQCKHCDKAFFSRAKRTGHQIQCSKRNGSIHKCPVEGCEYSTVNKSSLTAHQTAHSNARPFQCTWKDCTQRFKFKASLRKHLDYHRLEENLIEPKFKCSICSKGFIIANAYAQHMRCHKGLRPFLCDQCPMAFKDNHTLHQHLWRHTKNKSDTPSDFSKVKRKRVSDAELGDTHTNTTAPPGERCQICGDTCVLYNLGSVTTCVPCKLFFEYSEQTKQEMRAGNRAVRQLCVGNCTITPETRAECKECRLKKCYEVGLTFQDVMKRSSRPHTPAIKRPYVMSGRRRRGGLGVKAPKPPAALKEARVEKTKGSACAESDWRPPTDVGVCSVCSKTSRISQACGTRACNNCRKFFIDAVRRKRVFACIARDSCCFSWGEGDYCSSCRYQKCLSVGMIVEDVLEVTPKITVTGKCPVCEDEDVSLKTPYEIPACSKCCLNFWATVRHNRIRSCPKVKSCGNVAKCLGCRWKRYMDLGFNPQLVEDRIRTRKATADKVSKTPCAVCGDTGKYKRRGGFVCHSCLLFFYRSSRAGNEPTCKKGGNCSIDILTRIDCPGCRVQKCLSIGICRRVPYKERSKKWKEEESCEVCGDIAVGIRYGALNCDSCMYFFMKGHDRDFGGCSKGGNCELTRETRGNCQVCRLSKCHELGMQRTRFERREGKRWGKIARDSAEAKALRKAKELAQSTATPSEHSLDLTVTEDQEPTYSFAMADLS